MKNGILKKLIKNNSGSTMVETLVAFLVIMIVLAALYGMVRFSTNLRMRAVDTADVRNLFGQEIYKNTPDPSVVDVFKYIGKNTEVEDDKKTMFMLKLNTTKTDLEKTKYSGSNSSYDYKNAVIRIPCINATGYVSKDSRITDENLATPKVLSFEYDKDTQY